MSQLREVSEIVEDLKHDFELTDFEALQIAVKIQKNELYARAHLVSSDGQNTKYPVALEKIGMELEAIANNISEISQSNI